MTRHALVTLVILQGFIGFIVGTAFGVWWERREICWAFEGSTLLKDAYEVLCDDTMEGK